MAHLSYIYNSPNKQHFIFIQKKTCPKCESETWFRHFLRLLYFIASIVYMELLIILYSNLNTIIKI